MLDIDKKIRELGEKLTLWRQSDLQQGTFLNLLNKISFLGTVRVSARKFFYLYFPETCRKLSDFYRLIKMLIAHNTSKTRVRSLSFGYQFFTW